MKDKFNAGCCGHPPSCEQSGRCKAREDYSTRKEAGTKTMDDALRESMTRHEWDTFQSRCADRAKRERKHERGGRELRL